MLSYRRGTALQGGLVMAQMEDWNWKTKFTDIIGLSSTTVTHLVGKAIEFSEKRKIRVFSTPFKRSLKVIDVSINRKPV